MSESPSSAGPLESRLVLSPDQQAEMVAHCLKALPFEGCGLIVGDPGSGEVVHVVKTANTAQSSRLYMVDSRDYLRTDRAASDEGLAVIGVFHSHTHTDAYPSPTDVAQAPDPGWHYVLVSLRAELPSIRSYRILGAQVIEEPIDDTAI